MTTSSLELMDLNSYRYEMGPIRPPSKAFSLLVRATRNCSWNKCVFCRPYAEQRFELRTAEDVIADIEHIRAIKDGITFPEAKPACRFNNPERFRTCDLATEKQVLVDI